MACVQYLEMRKGFCHISRSHLLHEFFKNSKLIPIGNLIPIGILDKFRLEKSNSFEIQEFRCRAVCSSWRNSDRRRKWYLRPLFHLPVPCISSLVLFNFYCQNFVIDLEYLNGCGIFEEFQLEFRLQKQQASSIVFENAFKLLLGNRSFKILITKQLVLRILRHELERLFTKPFKSFADFLFKKWKYFSA